MITYENTFGGSTFTWNFDGQIVSVDANTDSLTADILQLAARDAEASQSGIGFDAIIEAEGKAGLTDTTATDLTVTLLDDWLILTEKQSGLFSVGGGNTVSDRFGVNIFAPNTNVSTQNNTSSSGTRVLTQGASEGFTEADRTVLSEARDHASATNRQTQSG